MSTTTATLSRELAEAALEAVKARFASYLQPMHLPATADLPAMDLSPTCPEPTLSDQWSEGWAIVWEEGPDEWTYRATTGGTSEDERVMAAEFGITLPDEDAATFPAGVYAEPYNGFVLALYPA